MGRVVEFQTEIPYLENASRTIHVYLPKDYDKRTDERFPVLYMHDGQNLFFNRKSFGGFSWGIKHQLEAAERKEKTNGIIVVGIENEGDLRIFEYSGFPFHDFSTGENSQEFLGEEYADFIVRDLKPLIDENFRTLPEPETTWMAGSSAGANISFYTGFRYPEVFSKIGLFSTALWLFDDGLIEDFMCTTLLGEDGQLTDQARRLRSYIYAGTEEGGHHHHHLISQGYIDSAVGLCYGMFQLGMDASQIRLDIAHGKDHSERSWRVAFPKFLDFILES